jgi:TfoX/Sxy family transcriptional regulator of competence genes
MPTKQSTADYIVDQLAAVGDVRVRKMFGEYALYCGSKVVALICDDTLFVKVTEAGKKFAGEFFKEGIPYPGAKPAILVSEEKLEDREWLCELVRVTFSSLPEPKKKKPKAR